MAWVGASLNRLATVRRDSPSARASSIAGRSSRSQIEHLIGHSADNSGPFGLGHDAFAQVGASQGRRGQRRLRGYPVADRDPSRALRGRRGKGSDGDLNRHEKDDSKDNR